MSNGKNGWIAFVVDDETLVASTLELILMSEGFDAWSFADPVDALKAAESVLPHLLLTDVALPHMTGIQLAIQMKQICPACKVLLFSGHLATTDLLESARSAGHHFEILAKPVPPVELLETIRGLFTVQGAERD